MGIIKIDFFLLQKRIPKRKLRPAIHVKELEDATNVMAEAKLLPFSHAQPDSARKVRRPSMDQSSRLAFPAVVMDLIIPTVKIVEEVEFASIVMVKESTPPSHEDVEYMNFKDYCCVYKFVISASF